MTGSRIAMVTRDSVFKTNKKEQAINFSLWTTFFFFLWAAAGGGG